MSNAFSELEKVSEAERGIKRLTTLVHQTEENFKQYPADELIRNLAYYRGEFWGGDGYSGAITASLSRNYAAVQNEMFPIIDTIASALALDLPCRP